MWPLMGGLDLIIRINCTFPEQLVCFQIAGTETQGSDDVLIFSLADSELRDPFLIHNSKGRAWRSLHFTYYTFLHIYTFEFRTRNNL